MVCMDCLKRQQRINELEEELAGVKAKLRYQERTAQEGPFKSSTPRSKIPVKPNSLPERQARRRQTPTPGSGTIRLRVGQSTITSFVPMRFQNQ